MATELPQVWLPQWPHTGSMSLSCVSSACVCDVSHTGFESQQPGIIEQMSWRLDPTAFVITVIFQVKVVQDSWLLHIALCGTVHELNNVNASRDDVILLGYSSH